MTEEGEAVNIILAEPKEGQIGISRRKTSLVIDLDRDGFITLENDLNITDFFDESGTGAGNGFIENVANLSGNDIINFLTDDTDLVSNSNVYRFLNTDTAAHFYTASTIEKESVDANLLNLVSEGNEDGVGLLGSSYPYRRCSLVSSSLLIYKRGFLLLTTFPTFSYFRNEFTCYNRFSRSYSRQHGTFNFWRDKGIPCQH